MNRDKRIPLLLVTNGLLFFLLTEVNALLAPVSLYLTGDALYVLFAAVYLRLKDGLLVVFVTAFVVDAMHPAPLGSSAVLYLAAYAVIIRLRLRLRRENRLHIALVGLIANTVIFLGLMIAVEVPNAGEATFWIRAMSDLLFSQVIIFLVAARLIDLQRSLLYHYGVDVAAELQTL